jgi:hypothetical protein
MQDIVPPKRPNPQPQNRQADKSLRLQGHSLDEARDRLAGSSSVANEQEIMQKPPQEIPHYMEPQKPRTQDPIENKSPRRTRPMDWWRAWSKPRKIITVLIILLLIGAAASAATYSLFWRVGEPGLSITKRKVKKPAPPTTVASPLTGLQVTPAEAARPVTGIMIENSQDARPQSGIGEAGVVYEAIAEGGITRFLTLYQEARPAYVGPVRSLRPYYLDFLVPFDASIAHVGGSPDALAQVRNGMKDLDQFFNSGSYWRVTSRYAPHNVYTSFDKMDALNTSKGYTSSKVIVWPRKADKKVVVKKTTVNGKTTTAAPPAPTAAKINLAISSANFNVHYDYDATSNSYLRSEGGAAHNATVSEADKTGAQLHPKVVVALVMPYSIVDSSGHSGYNTNGTGAAYIFQDGDVVVGTWTKDGRSGQIQFTDAAGKAVELNTGQVWLTLLGAANLVTYSP